MPDYASGKICYIEIPTTDVARSAEFYAEVFGWATRRRPNGTTAFDDAVRQVSGSWVVGRPPAESLGVLVYAPESRGAHEVGGRGLQSFVQDRCSRVLVFATAGRACA